MSHRHLLAAAALLFGCGLLTVSAQGKDPFTGRWVANQSPYKISYVIAKDGDRWAISGSWAQDGEVKGKFVGEDAEVKGGQLVFKHRFTKAPPGRLEFEGTSFKPTSFGLEFWFKTRSGALRYQLRREEVVKEDKAAIKGDLAALPGVWKGPGPYGWEETWTVTRDGDKWELKAVFLAPRAGRGRAHGEDIAVKGNGLSFRRVIDIGPTSKYKHAPCTLVAEGDRAELVVLGGPGGRPSDRIALKREVAVVSKDKGKEPPPMPKDEKEKALIGVWAGEYPGLDYKVILEVKKSGPFWDVEVLLLNAAGIPAGHFQRKSAPLAAEGLRVDPAWRARPKGVEASAVFVLAGEGEGLRLEVRQGAKKASSVLKRGDEKTEALLRNPPKDPNAPVEVGGLIWGMGFLDEGKTLVVGMSTGEIKFLDVEKREFTRKIDAGLAMAGFGVSPKGDAFSRSHMEIVGKVGGVTELFDTAGKVTATLPGTPLGQEALRFSPDGKMLLSSDRGSPGKSKPGLMLRSLPDGKTLAKIERADLEAPTGLGFAQDGKRFCWAGTYDDVKAGRTRFIAITDLKGKVLTTLLGVHRGNVNACAFSPDGASLASVDGNGQLVVWNIKTRKAVRGAVLGTKGGTVLDVVAYSPDGKEVIVGQNEGNVYFRDAKTLAETQTLKPVRKEVKHFAFSPAGLMAIGSSDLSGQIAFVKLTGMGEKK